MAYIVMKHPLSAGKHPAPSAPETIPDHPAGTRFVSWKGPLPEFKGRLEASLILPVPLSPYAMVDIEETIRYIESLGKLMGRLFPRRHEILLVPFGKRQPTLGLLLSRLTQSTANRKNFRWIGGNHSGPGSAVREAVLLSQGRVILVGSLEYLYDPSFFKEALALLRPGNAGVRANRRLPDSEFTVPVSVLSMVYRRHLLGSALSRIWSRLFSLHLTDFLSGAYVLRRDFALCAFTRITCPGFLYEAEIAILAQANDRLFEDIPARFFLEKEKPRLRVWGEIVSVLAWTWRLFIGVRRGEYASLQSRGNQLTADDWGLSPGINEGILALANLGHVRRVSALAGGRHLDYRLAELKKIPGIEFGLHFNMTNSESGGEFKSPALFLWHWIVSRGVNGAGLAPKVRRALTEQIRALQKRDIRPMRLDGHHHIHAVPGLLAEVADILEREDISTVRVPYHRSLWFGRKMPIAWLGFQSRKAVQELKFGTTPFYYPGRGDFSSLNRLVRALNRNSNAEILIHPAAWNDLAQAAPSDGYGRERVDEFLLLRLLAFALKTPAH